MNGNAENVFMVRFSKYCQEPANGHNVQVCMTICICSGYANADSMQLYIQEVNLATGYICGIMRAENVPQAKTPVVTFWEGDIIDNVNHSFMTTKWGAEKSVDVKHWLKFDGFKPLSKAVQASGGR